MRKKTLAPCAAAALAVTVLAGCSGAVDEAKQKAADKAKEVSSSATQAAKAEASKAAEKAVASATEAAKAKAQEAIDSGTKFDPNTVSEQQVAAALMLGGVPEPATVAKDIKAAGPFTNENMATKLQEVAKKHDISSADMEKVLKYLEVKE